MLQRTLMQLTSYCAGLVLLTLSLTAQAGTINIQATNLDLSFSGDSGGAIFDSPDAVGGNLDPTEADVLGAVEYNFNGNPPPASGGNNILLSGGGTDFHGDFLVDDVGTTVPISFATLSTIGGGGYEFGFDLFSNTGGGSSPILRLEFDTVNVLLNAGVLLITAKADIVQQDLPFGLVFDGTQQVDFAYTATGPGITGTATDADMFVASGTINISGPDSAGAEIPEPANTAVLFFCLLGIVLTGSRRRRRV